MYSKYINENDKSNKTIFGDASAASLISLNGKGLEINEFVFGTDGSGFDNLIVKNGGLVNRNLSGFDLFDTEDNFVRNDNYLYMNGREIFNFTAQNIPALISKVLNKNNLLKDQVDLFIFHQANKFILDFLKKKILIDENKFYIFIEKCGNTVSSSIPIAIKEAIDEKLVDPNKKTLIAGFGVGYSWCSTILGKLN